MLESIRVNKGFPMTPGETLRVKLPGTKDEIKIKVGRKRSSSSDDTHEVYDAQDSFHKAPQGNKSPVTLLNDPTRKLPREGRRQKWVGFDYDD